MATNEKKLRRLPEQGQIAGVCAGLADYFDIDVTLVRLIFIVLAIVTGGGMVLAYLVLALVVPAADEVGSTEAKETDKTMNLSHNAEVLAAEMRDSGRGDRLRNYFGVGLILVGLWLLLGQVFPGWFLLRWEYIWPIVLIVFGVYIATRRKG